jgi:L-threonylcarbamoyladenylate synthase
MRMIRIDRAAPDEGLLDEAAAVIQGGGVVIVPTDTVYGLAAGPHHSDALERIRRIKRRPEGMGLAVIVACADDIRPLVRDLSPEAARMLADRLPGPVTFVLVRNESFPETAAPGRSTIAVRVPDCEVAVGLARRTGPYAATSANVTGEKPPVTLAEIANTITNQVDLALDAGPCPIGRASALVDLTGPDPVVIREGPGWG